MKTALQGGGLKGKKRIKTNDSENQSQAKFSKIQIDNEESLPDTPREISSFKFAEARAAEILDLEEKCRILSKTSRVFQRLPHDMRRRVMNHELRRLPRRLQSVAAKEYENQSGKKKKRPSRKYRRRPKNIESAYAQRQRSVRWLDTHIWHAKRFHMTTKWGYRLPLHATNKCYRSSYRASHHRCLLQDVSFMECVEVIGPQSRILSVLSHLTSQQSGLTFAAKACLRGDREGETTLYEYDRYPYGAIAIVQFMWQSEHGAKSDATQRCLWVWSHAAATNDVTVALNGAFSHSEHEGSAADDVHRPTLTTLRDELCRFHLTGPQSMAVLQNVLRPVEIQLDATPVGTVSPWWVRYYRDSWNVQRLAEQSDWWARVRCVQSADMLLTRMVVGLTVRDPRFVTTEVTHDGAVTAPDNSIMADTGSDKCTSALWKEEVRRDVKNTQKTDAEVNEMKGRLVLSEHHDDCESRIPVVLIQRPGRRSQPAQTHGSYGCGWDVITPQSWARQFWRALVYQKTRIGGLREIESISREMGRLSFPGDFPDTPAGKREADILSAELTEKYSRRPPAKRSNYTKLGVHAAFRCPWDRLVREWNGKVRGVIREVDGTVKGDVVELDDTNTRMIKCDGTVDGNEHENESFIVLRDRKKLRLIDDLLRHNENKDTMESEQILTRNDVRTLLHENLNSLVAVTVAMKSGGVPKRFSSISAPRDGDLIVTKSGMTELKRTHEPVHRDYGGEQRKAERGRKRAHGKNHTGNRSELDKIVMEKLISGNCEQIEKVDKTELVGVETGRDEEMCDDSAVENETKRYAGLEEGEEVNIGNRAVDTDVGDTGGSSLVRTESSHNRDLGAETASPDLGETMIDSCSRLLIGYINKGDYSFLSGYGVGVGFCPLAALLCHVNTARCGRRDAACVLIRNPTSLEYKLAEMSVLLSS